MNYIATAVDFTLLHIVWCEHIIILWLHTCVLTSTCMLSVGWWSAMLTLKMSKIACPWVYVTLGLTTCVNSVLQPQFLVAWLQGYALAIKLGSVVAQLRNDDPSYPLSSPSSPSPPSPSFLHLSSLFSFLFLSSFPCPLSPFFPPLLPLLLLSLSFPSFPLLLFPLLPLFPPPSPPSLLPLLFIVF